MLQHCVSLESWSQYRGPGQENQYQRGILKSVKHSQCLKGSIRDFVNQSSQHKCYCGESDVWVLCGHNNNTSEQRPVSSQWRRLQMESPRGPDNGSRLFSDILLLLLFTNLVTRESDSAHCFIPALGGSRPHRLITCLFVFVLTNLTQGPGM